MSIASISSVDNPAICEAGRAVPIDVAQSKYGRPHSTLAQRGSDAVKVASEPLLSHSSKALAGHSVTDTQQAPYVDTGYSDLNAIEDAVSQRRSVRGFLPDPIPRETVERILALAARSPSGTNMQPWNVHVVTGEARQRLVEAVLDAFNDPNQSHEDEWEYYPAPLHEPYISRRRTVGWALYNLLGIKKGERDKTHAQHARNFRFFDAPVGLICTLDKKLQIGSWLDYGMFLENIMILARAHGYETCPQAAFAHYHKVLRGVLPISDEETVICGMSLGVPDWSRIENTLVTEREPLTNYVSFHED